MGAGKSSNNRHDEITGIYFVGNPYSSLHSMLNNLTQFGDNAEMMDPETLTLQILELIHNVEYKDIMLQSQFTDLLGFDALDFITELISNRQLIMKFTARFMNFKDGSHIEQYQESQMGQAGGNMYIPQRESANPYGPSFVIQTETQKQQKKQKIKESKRRGKKSKPARNKQSRGNRNDQVAKRKNKDMENYNRTMELLGYKRKNEVDFDKEVQPMNTTTTVHKCMLCIISHIYRICITNPYHIQTQLRQDHGKKCIVQHQRRKL